MKDYAKKEEVNSNGTNLLLWFCICALLLLEEEED
jgi:hypothetical protein